MTTTSTSETTSTTSSTTPPSSAAKSAAAAGGSEDAALVAAVVTATGEIDLVQLDRLLASVLPSEAVREAAAAAFPNNDYNDTDAIIDTVATFDVLCGRGGETNHHAGNIQYRQLVKLCQPAYIAAKRREKPKIAQSIVKAVRSLGGRFLKKSDCNNSNNSNSSTASFTRKGGCGNNSGGNSTGGGVNGTDVNNNNLLWKDVGDNKAREKTSQGT
jgi:hypothetical protein